MEVVLLQDIDNLGVKNDLVTVKPGYGRNYLIPQGMAVVANKANRKWREELVKQTERKEEKMLAGIQATVDKLTSATLKVGAKVGTSGKIFGSVTPMQIADSIKKQLGAEVDRKKIELNEEVKTLGTYTATVKLHKSIDDVEVKFEVVEE